MAVTYSKPERIDLLSVRCRFRSDRTPPVTLRVGCDGILAKTILSTDGSGEYIALAGPADGPTIEVLDHDAQRFAPAYSGRLTLQWDRVESTSYYLVEELVAAVWTERARVTQTGMGAYQWQTRKLEDGQTHQFRVTPTGRHGQAWPTKSWSFTVTRTPDVPNVSYTFDVGTGNITIDNV